MDLVKSIKMQFILMINSISFKVGFSIVMVYVLASYIISLISSMSTDIAIMYSAHALFCGVEFSALRTIFEVVFPFLVVFPFSFSYLTDLSVKIHPYFIGRMGRRNYFAGKIITNFIGTFIMIFVPFCVNLLLCYITFPWNNNHIFGDYNALNYASELLGTNVTINTVQAGLPFLKLFLYSPMAYNFMYICIFSVFSGLAGVLSGIVSFYIKTYKILLFIPVYLLFYIGNFLNILSVRFDKYINFRLMDYIYVNPSFGRSFFVPLCFVVFMLVASFFSFRYACKKEEL